MEDTPGTYVLVMQMVRDTDLRVGRLGVVAFPSGYYCYVGSALGPGGWRARLARHLRQQKKPHWHIDYLLRQAPVVEIWSGPCAARVECTWARALLQLPGATLPVRGFGSSDCHCPAHLVRLASGPSLRAFAKQLQALGLEILPHKVTPQQIAPGRSRRSPVSPAERRQRAPGSRSQCMARCLPTGAAS